MAKFSFYLPRYHTNAAPWIRILHSAGHQAVVNTSHIGPTESHAILRPRLARPSLLMRLFRVRSDSPIDQIPSLRQVWLELAAEAPDVVIVRGVTRWLSRVAIVCALIQRRRLVIYDQEDASPKEFSTRFRRAFFRLLGIPHVTARIGSHQNPGRLGNATSLPFGCPYAGMPAGVFKTREALPSILMVAKYRDRKGHKDLLEAMGLVSKERRCPIVFCGEEVSPEDVAFCESLKRHASELGVLDLVSFKNNVPYESMGDLYSHYQIFALPSRNEPAAVSPIEAAWSGCAVLISADSGTRGYIPPGKEWEFQPGVISDLARAIEGLLSSSETVVERGAECRRFINLVANDSIILQKFNSFLG